MSAAHADARPGRGAYRIRGFTLVELLVVVSIIAMLISILMPSLGRAKDITRKTICQTNLKALGSAWLIYWNDNGNKHPGMVLGDRGGLDSISQWNDQLYGSWRNWTGAGFLWRDELLTGGNVYVCPSVKAEVGGTWFTGNWSLGGPWPVADNPGSQGYTWMTYGIRRMANYDNSFYATADSWDSSSKYTDKIMLMKSGVGVIEQPVKFAIMADCFKAPWFAERSHVPGVNVLYQDGHAGYYEDKTEDGDILYYGNGITDTSHFNWYHDDIWMILSDYHQPPVGQ